MDGAGSGGRRTSETDEEYRITGGLLAVVGALLTYWAWSAARGATTR